MLRLVSFPEVEEEEGEDEEEKLGKDMLIEGNVTGRVGSCMVGRVGRVGRVGSVRRLVRPFSVVRGAVAASRLTTFSAKG